MSRLYLYPLWVRIWHWINALLFITLIVTGLYIHYTPDWLTSFDFRTSVIVHNITGILLGILFCLFIIFNFITGNNIHYKVKLKGLPNRLVRQTVYYMIGIFRGEPHPFSASMTSKFNPLQQLTYIGVMLGLFPPLVITGLVLLFPFQATELTGTPNIIIWIALAHSILAFFSSMFIAVHIYIATTGDTPWSNFRAMLTGWHSEKNES